MRAERMRRCIHCLGSSEGREDGRPAIGSDLVGGHLCVVAGEGAWDFREGDWSLAGGGGAGPGFWSDVAFCPSLGLSGEGRSSSARCRVDGCFCMIGESFSGGVAGVIATVISGDEPFGMVYASSGMERGGGAGREGDDRGGRGGGIDVEELP